jgi:tetratricopeptide (TPR) repeat protein
VSRAVRLQTKKILREAEGYLELEMPLHALQSLDRLAEEARHRSQALYLRGESLRSLERYEEALAPLEQSADIAPGNIHIWLALGWCYKRTGHLDRAIAALEDALEFDCEESEKALLYYNLGCYWALKSEKPSALDYLARAFDIDPGYRDLVGNESDFDSLRSDPDFLALTSIIV